MQEVILQINEKELVLLTAMVAKSLEAMVEVTKEERNEEMKEIGMALASLSLKVLMARGELKEKDDEAMDAGIL